jgi:glutathione S-transferase
MQMDEERMEPILFAGYPLGSSLGLIAAFEWLGQPYRVSRVKMPDDMVTRAYAEVNGRQETPMLVTDDGVLTETMAIALWLERRDRGHRVSFAAASRQSDRLHQYMAFLNSSFTAAFSPLWAALEMQGVSDQVRETLRSFGRRAVAKRHRQLEGMLGEGKYMLGDTPTLADAMFIGVARWADFHQAVDPGDYPRILALKETLEADRAVMFAHAIEEGRPATDRGAMVEFVAVETALRRAIDAAG